MNLVWLVSAQTKRGLAVIESGLNRALGALSFVTIALEMQNACTHGHDISYDLQIKKRRRKRERNQNVEFYLNFKKLINYHHDNVHWFRQQ